MTPEAATTVATVDAGTTGHRFSHADFTSELSFQLPERRITREAIVRFGRRYDPQPFHVDERAARASVLKGLSASGWHTCTVFTSALHEGFLDRCRDARMFAIDEIKWLFPVRPDDRIKGSVRARAIDAAGPWPGSGQIEIECVATTEKGRRVMTWKGRVAIEGYDGNQVYGGASDDASAALERRAGVLAHFDDISVGDEVSLGGYRISADAIRDFVVDYGLSNGDPGANARAEADGWHIAAIFMSQLVRYYLREAAALRRKQVPVPGLGPSPGIRRLRWWAPVRAGDELTFRACALRKAEIAPRSNWGMLTGACAAVNQFGQKVLTFEGQLLLERHIETASD